MAKLVVIMRLRGNQTERRQDLKEIPVFGEYRNKIMDSC